MASAGRLYPAHASPADAELIERAMEQMGPTDWRQLNAERLGEIAETVGLDLATAHLWACLQQSSAHGDFIRGVDVGDPPPPAERPVMLIVPGAFYRNHRDTGADGRRLLAFADEFGWASEMLQLSSLGALKANASAVLNRLRELRGRKILLVSLSKGSCDVAAAFGEASAEGAFGDVCGWVSISGITTGTPLVAWLRARRLRTMGVHLYLWARGLRFAAVDELRRGIGASLDRPIVLPPGLPAIHVVGFPLRRHLRHPWAPRAYERLASLGPSDGGGFLLGDVTRLPGLIYPVWGADHYLNPAWDIAGALRSILLHAAASQTTASAMPTSRSSA